MNIEILNTNFEVVKILNEYESFIWTERYNTPGDFELYTPVTADLLKTIKRNYYVQIADSRKLMIIEDIEYRSTSEDSGNHIKVTGRSLESLLDRRIAYYPYGKFIMRGDLQTSIEILFDENFINPSDPDRKIDNFEFHYSIDQEIAALTVDATYDGESILQIVEDLSNMYDLGWRINFVRDPTPHFVFIFFNGTDRSSRGGVTDNRVIFSPEYENVIQSTYTVMGSDYKTLMVVGGEFNEEVPDPEGGEGATKTETRPVYVSVGSGVGLNRREIFVKENGIEKDKETTLDEYKASMRSFGEEELAKHRITKQFDGEYETKRIFVYGEDFTMGDIVDVIDEFGNRACARIVEYIRSNSISDGDGETAYPTFRTVDLE